MTRDFTPIKKCCLGCHQKVLDTYEIKHGQEKDEKVNTTNYADLPIFRVPTLKNIKPKKMTFLQQQLIIQVLKRLIYRKNLLIKTYG